MAFMVRFPDSGHADTALMKIGAAGRLSGNIEAACRAYNRLTAEYPDSLFLADASIEVLTCLYGEGRFSDVVEQATDLREQMALPEQKARLEMLLGDTYGAMENPVEAFYYYAAAVEHTQDTTGQAIADKLKQTALQLETTAIRTLLYRLESDALARGYLLYQMGLRQIADKNDAAALTVKEREYPALLRQLKTPPDLVICDSQVVLKMVGDTTNEIPCTTFSILFARLKGDLPKFAAGAAAIDNLKDGDKVLIAESCSHHAAEDDIGRVKIPRWLRQYCGCELEIDVYAGRDFPENLSEYSLVVQCGGCMHNRREILSRIEKCEAAGVPITNYGLCISQTQGVLKRVLSPFPAALDAYERLLRTT